MSSSKKDDPARRERGRRHRMDTVYDRCLSSSPDNPVPLIVTADNPDLGFLPHSVRRSSLEGEDIDDNASTRTLSPHSKRHSRAEADDSTSTKALVPSSNRTSVASSYTRHSNTANRPQGSAVQETGSTNASMSDILSGGEHLMPSGASENGASGQQNSNQRGNVTGDGGSGSNTAAGGYAGRGAIRESVGLGDDGRLWLEYQTTDRGS